MLVKDISVLETDQGRWVLRTAGGRHVLLNQASAALVQILQEHRDYEDARLAFNLHFNVQINMEAFRKIIKDKLSGYQILMEEEGGKVEKKGKYLYLQTPLFSPLVAGILSAPFRFLYSFAAFRILTVMLVCVIVWALINYPPLHVFVWSDARFLLLACLVYPSVLIHELGHIAACQAAGTRHGEIGFGFYLIFPVLYSDVTNIWQAQKKQRIVVNLAGACNELLYASCLLLISHFTGNGTLLIAFYLISLKVLFELNPFVRMDGYWVFSDITNTPNLLPKANMRVKEVLQNLFSGTWRIPHSFNKTDKLLFAYGMANAAVVLVYVSYVVVTHFTSIVQFPGILTDLFDKAIRMKLSFNDLKREYLFVLIFYWITIRIFYRLIIKNSRVASVKLDRVAY